MGTGRDARTGGEGATEWWYGPAAGDETPGARQVMTERSAIGDAYVEQNELNEEIRNLETELLRVAMALNTLVGKSDREPGNHLKEEARVVIENVEDLRAQWRRYLSCLERLHEVRQILRNGRMA